MGTEPRGGTMNAYIHTLRNELRKRGFTNPDLLPELEGHLLESVERGRREGLSPAEAERRALERFGSPAQVAHQFFMESNHMKQIILFVGSIFAGVLIAFIDSRPTWDDTGITVFALLACGAVIGLLLTRRPWLFALALGIWMPLIYIVTKHDFMMLITLIFPFLGVYAGWAARKLSHKLLHSA